MVMPNSSLIFQVIHNLFSSEGSKDATGSSAKIIAGSCAKARAIEIRCC